MVTVRLFASAREAAGTDRVELAGSNVGEVLDEARRTLGESFSAVLEVSNVWLNGEAVELDTAVADGDEVAVLPPVSGGL